MCQTRERGALDILMARLRGERRVFDSYNKHRLGDAAFRYYQAVPTPEDAEAKLQSLGEEIEEDLENFPLRFQVVVGGFDALTEDLQPIYQVADHATRLASKAQTPAPIPVTPSKPTPKSTQPGTPKAEGSYDKLQGSPAPNLDFPTGNVTLAEMAAFHPQSLKSWDMIDRFCGNGGSQATFAVMVNHFRQMSRGPITANSVYRLLKAPMMLRAKTEDPRYVSWTTGIHDQFHDAANFDTTSVSVTGFRTAADGKNRTSAAPILIKDMANGVQKFPTGNDALDLTRAVRYCQEHPDKQWLYPTDFERLVNEKLGGPARVKAAHHDAAIIARYTSNRIAAGVSSNKLRKRDSRGRLQKVESEEEEDIEMTDSDDGSDEEVDFEALDKKRSKRKAVLDDSDSDEDATPSCKRQKKRAKTSPKSRPSRNTPRRTVGPSRLRQSILADDIDSDSEDAYLGPKKKKAVASVRRSSRKTKITQTYDIDTFGKFVDEEEDVPRQHQESDSDDNEFEDEG